MLKKALFTVSFLSSIVFCSSLAFSAADFTLMYKYNFDMSGPEGVVAMSTTTTTAPASASNITVNDKAKKDSSSQQSSAVINNNNSTKQVNTPRRAINSYQDFKSGIVFIP